MILHMLTTMDNPFDPFTQFDEWFAFDTQKGYNTSAYLARIVRNSDALSPTDQDLALEQAIDEIVRLNVRGVHIKITADEGRKIKDRYQRMLEHSDGRLIHVSKAIEEFVENNFEEKEK